ncbi:MAG: hypothetical protein E7576_12070 [Ruminococcaceae bacterium]|nr:hypothetical protein [Oscillospiraceae bacterium]
MSKLTVYADALFLVNLSMDILTLAAVCAVTHRKARRGRLIAAAVFGALCATVSVLLPDPGPLLRSAAGILTACGMAAAGFGIRGTRGLLRDTVMIWGAGALLGGVMTALFSLGTPVFSSGGSFPAAYLVCAALSFLWTRIRRSEGDAKQVRILIEAAGERAEVTGLCDTGSSAREPIGGLPAILVKRRAVPGLSSLLDRTLAGEATGMRLRMIPVKGVGGDRLLPGFLPDRVLVGSVGTEAAVALDGEGERYGEGDALLPCVLCP